MTTINLKQDPLYPDSVQVNVPTPLERKTDHVEEGVARLISQYADKPRIVRLLSAYLRPLQEAEDALWTLIDQVNLNNATGITLDYLGKILNQGRLGLSDQNYRTVLRARVRVLLSSGKVDELLTILRLVTIDSTEAAQLEAEVFDGIGIVLKLRSELGPVDQDIVFSLLNQAKAGGVPLNFVFGLDPADELFVLGSTVDGETFSSTQGLGNTEDPSPGGALSSCR